MRLGIIDASSSIHDCIYHETLVQGSKEQCQNDKLFVRSGKVDTPDSFLAEWNWGTQEN
jgi:hypothetical protein